MHTSDIMLCRYNYKQDLKKAAQPAPETTGVPNVPRTKQSSM